MKDGEKAPAAPTPGAPTPAAATMEEILMQDSSESETLSVKKGSANELYESLVAAPEHDEISKAMDDLDNSDSDTLSEKTGSEVYKNNHNGVAARSIHF